MPLTPPEIELIETIATEQLKYESILSAQAEVPRTGQPNLEAAMARIQQSPLVAEHSQQWETTKDNVGQYLAQCDDICQLVPQNFVELSVLKKYGGFAV
jgi:hypothetical protein